MNAHKALSPVNMSFHNRCFVNLEASQRFGSTRGSMETYLNSDGCFRKLNTISDANHQLVEVLRLSIQRVAQLQRSLILLQQEFIVIAGYQRIFQLADGVGIGSFDRRHQLAGSQILRYHVARRQVAECWRTVVLVHDGHFNLKAKEKRQKLVQQKSENVPFG